MVNEDCTDTGTGTWYQVRVLSTGTVLELYCPEFYNTNQKPVPLGDFGEIDWICSRIDRAMI